MNSTLVRVVLPAYNRALLLPEAVESVRQQTHRDWELVIVDDGSTDRTYSVAARLAATDSRIRVIRQPNGGAASARNRGIDEPGECDYIAFLDSDDTWYAHHLADTLTAFCRHPEIGVVFSRFETVDSTNTLTAADHARRTERMDYAVTCAGKDEGGIRITAHEILSALLSARICPATPTVLIRSALLKTQRFETSLPVLEDVLLWIELASQGTDFGVLDQVNARVRLYGDNLTGRRSLGDPATLRRQRSVHRFNQMKRRYCKSRSDKRAVGTALSNSSFLLGQCCVEHGSRLLAVRWYLESICHGGGWQAARSLIGAMLPPSVKGWLTTHEHRRRARLQEARQCE